MDKKILKSGGLYIGETPNEEVIFLSWKNILPSSNCNVLTIGTAVPGKKFYINKKKLDSKGR